MQTNIVLKLENSDNNPTPNIRLMSADNIDARLAAEVTTLSTRLVTEVAKLLELEETILHLRKQNSTMKLQVSELLPLEESHRGIKEKYEALVAKAAVLEKEKAVAEEKNKQLEGEVEDLTASLFNEANIMVSNASRETYNFKLKNRKLIEELAEKDVIIESLQAQLKDLKTLFQKMEDQQRSSRTNTPKMDHRFDGQSEADVSLNLELDETASVLYQLMYGPRVRAIRFDLPIYQTEFKSFIFQLIKPDFSFDLANLKTVKYFRKLWIEELEPSVPTIPAISGNFINRWSKGKSFWNLLVEGRAIIEPISGVNETFRLTYKGAKTGAEVPVATKDPCAFCGEHKEDLLEHARLYNLKLFGPAAESGPHTTEIGGEAHEVVGVYPLCNFCLVKLRAICDFFAKLRLIHANIYKLRQNALYDEFALVSNFQFKRSSESLRTPKALPQTHAEDESIVLKLYMMLLVIRAKIFWSKIGFWDTEEDVECLSLDEINMDVFRDFVRDNVAFRAGTLTEVSTAGLVQSVRASESEPLDEERENEETEDEPEGETDDGDNREGTTDGTDANNDDNDRASSHGEKSDDEFADTLDTFHKDTVQRRGLSKEFKAKVAKDLDDTIGMLRESLDQ